MKKADIKIGSVYRAKVSDKLTDVRIDDEHPGGGWDATNLATKKKIRIKSAQRLRAPVMEGAQAKAVAAADQQNARIRNQRKASADGQTANSGGERAMSQAAKTTRGSISKTASSKAKAATPKPPKPRAKQPTAKSDPKANRVSGLDLAAKVLGESKEPLNAKTIAEQAIAAGWNTDGKTPHATLYAAMIREISAKGKDARFRKTDRGLFAAGKGA
jgi:hypothetical protein